MAPYTNPKGSPAVTFNGPATYTQQQLTDACCSAAPTLNTPSGIDAARLLWAIAGRESSFGTNCQPRHEAAYCTGRYSDTLTIATRSFGHAAHCSFGPWQLMWANSSQLAGPDKLFATIDSAAEQSASSIARSSAASTP